MIEFDSLNLKSIPTKESIIISLKNGSQSHSIFGNHIIGNSLNLIKYGEFQIYLLKTHDRMVNIPTKHIKNLIYLNHN